MNLDLHSLQVITAAVWFITTAALVPSVFRALINKDGPESDKWRSAMFFVGMLFTAFPSRWVLVPDDINSWKFLYIIGILSAVYVQVLIWKTRKNR